MEYVEKWIIVKQSFWNLIQLVVVEWIVFKIKSNQQMDCDVNVIVPSDYEDCWTYQNWEIWLNLNQDVCVNVDLKGCCCWRVKRTVTKNVLRSVRELNRFEGIDLNLFDFIDNCEWIRWNEWSEGRWKERRLPRPLNNPGVRVVRFVESNVMTNNSIITKHKMWNKNNEWMWFSSLILLRCTKSFSRIMGILLFFM